MTSKVPVVLTALLNLTRATLTAANVIDGEPLKGQPGDFIAIGHSSTGPAVENIERISDYGLLAPTEDFTVASEFVAWNGDTNSTDVRNRVYALLDPWLAALQADPRLGGACMLVQLERTALTQPQTTEGAMAVLEAVLRVRASRT